MRVLATLIGMIVLVPGAALADIKRHAMIPEALQGSWAPSADNCTAGDKAIIVLAAKAYSSGDTNCSVDWVSETAGPRGPTYSAHMQCTSQPGQKPSVQNLIIRPDGAKQISVGLSFGSLKAYQKCAAAQ
jgi:hypothetical protein